MSPWHVFIALLFVALPAAGDSSSQSYRVSGVALAANTGSTSGSASGRSLTFGAGWASGGDAVGASGLRVEVGSIFAPGVAVGDADGDGAVDVQDNCSERSNADQRDTDGDGYGNACDPDLNGDGITNFVDLAIMKEVFFEQRPDADLNGDAIVNFADLAILKARFFEPPGPSGLHR